MADFSWCSSRVATGAAINSPEDVRQIAQAGITFLVDTRAEFNPATLLANTGLSYLWNPTTDDGQPKPIEHWQRTLDFSLPLLAQPKHKGLFLCASGVNRGPSHAFAVLCALGWFPDQAETQIRAARPQAGILYKQSAHAAVIALGYG